MISKYLRCDNVYKEKILEITKKRVIMITLRIVLVLDVKKAANELCGPFVKVGAPHADIDSSNPPGFFSQKHSFC